MRRTSQRCTPSIGGVQHKPLDSTNSVPAIINQFVNISTSSAPIKTLTVRQHHRDFSLRPQLHLFLQSGPGSLKSTILEEVAIKHGVKPYSYVTYAAMIGSIDSMSGELIPGLVWQTRKKPLLLDEFRTGERGDTGSIDVLLGALESGMYKRKVSQRAQSFEETDGDLYYHAKDGEIEVKARFPCIIATMKDMDRVRSDKYRALAQRCILLKFTLTPEELDAILEGKPFYEFYKYDVPEDAVITRRDYQKILNIAKDFRKAHPKFQAEYARAVGDLCRITAVLDDVDPSISQIVCYLKLGDRVDKAQDNVTKVTGGS